MDSILLPNFVELTPNVKKIIDFCTGNAPIPMLMSFRTKARIFGVELQKDIYDLGMESILENKMDNQIELINGDVKKIKTVATGLIQAPNLMGIISILSTIMVVVATVATLYSCYDYIVKNIDVLKFSFNDAFEIDNIIDIYNIIL